MLDEITYIISISAPLTKRLIAAYTGNTNPVKTTILLDNDISLEIQTFQKNKTGFAKVALYEKENFVASQLVSKDIFSCWEFYTNENDTLFISLIADTADNAINGEDYHIIDKAVLPF